MNEIQELINTVNKNLHDKNILPTPSNYEKEFLSLVRNSDILLEDFVEFEEIKSLLNEEEKEEFKVKNVATFKELSALLTNRVPESDIKLFLKHLSFYMSPSLANKKAKSEVYEVCSQIASSPKELTNIENIRKLRKLTNSRIDADKELFGDKTKDVKKLIGFLDKYFTKVLNQHSTSLKTIHEIKDDIANINLSDTSKDDISKLQDKLLKTVSKIEDTLEKGSCDLKNNHDECVTLHQQIQVLQENLNKAEEEKSIDFLTGVLTRRAYEFEIHRIENEFQVFNSKYALVFFDIDHFKKVNDNYGHECGDVILETFAKILKKLTRVEDVITRYGGEEFIAVIHYNNIMEVKNYLSRAKNIITNNKFIYKNLKLKVQFSAGVTFRKNYSSYNEALKVADDLLYKAKNDGRNRIVLDTGDVL